MVDPSPASSPAHLLHLVGRILETEQVSWAAIGALAVAYHGVVRASLDADALIAVSDAGSELDLLVARLRSQGWTVDPRLGDSEDPLGLVIRILDSEGNQVDLIGGIRRLDPGFFKRMIFADMDGLSLHVASPEDLIALKIFAGSPKDMEDAAGVLQVLETGVDRDLVLRLCRRFGIAHEKKARKILERFPN